MATWRSVLTVAAKCLGAAILVVGIGLAVVALGPVGDVSTSRADIVDNFSAVDGDEAFRRALDEMGHEEARPYTLNGNRIYVSTANLDVAPRRALEDYQREFARRGLNEQVYRRALPRLGLDRTRDGLTGGLVPAVVTDDRVVMRGALGTTPSSDWGDLMERMADREHGGIGDLVEGFRWVEIHRPRGVNGAKAVAIWSGEGFEYEHMFPASLQERETAIPEDVPRCPGCTFVNQFGDPESEEQRGAYLWTSERSVRSLARYYRQVCRRREWSLSESSRWIDELARRLGWRHRRRVACRRGDRQLSVHVFRGGGDRTAVRVELGRRTDASEPRDEARSRGKQTGRASSGADRFGEQQTGKRGDR